jgi:hypothetical protein
MITPPLVPELPDLLDTLRDTARPADVADIVVVDLRLDTTGDVRGRPGRRRRVDGVIDTGIERELFREVGLAGARRPVQDDRLADREGSLCVFPDLLGD